MGTNTQLKKYYPKLQNRVESRGKITKFINNLWAGTEVISLKASGKRRLRLCSKQSLLRPLFGRSFLHPLIGTCTTLCRPLDRGFESSLFQNMDVPSLRAVIHLSSFPFLLVYPTFLVLLSLPNYLLPLFSSRPRLSCIDVLFSPPPSPAHRPPCRLNWEANFQLFSTMKFHEILATKCHSLG